ncbi:MAG TPA: hypothetical protein EYG80_04090 [Flavobacteriaceae bacterium]|nr:hypothetical protein [Flavobacteriaceae bacterium]
MITIQRHLNEYEKRYDVSLSIKSFCSLESIENDCPWNEYQSFSIEKFIKNNFMLLQTHVDFFDKYLSKLCKEIAFVKIYQKELQRDYWFTIYYLGEYEDKLDVSINGVSFLIGGEPEKSPVMLDSFKKNGWIDYPSELVDFWSIHGIWNSSIYGESDFDLINLSEELTIYEIDIPHYKAIKESSLDSLVGKNLYGYYSSDKKKDDFYIDKYFLDAIPLSLYSNSDGLHLIKPFDKQKFLEEFYAKNQCFNDFNSLYNYLLVCGNEMTYEEQFTQYFEFSHDGYFIGFCTFYDYLIGAIQDQLDDVILK